MTRPLTVGSLCTGIAGLDYGVELAGVDVDSVFVSDIDRGACDWLDANMPDTPNLGDFTALDSLPECDLLTAGFPCQPVSTAGRRAGIEDERWLFDDITRLVGRMETRPLLFLENVPGLLTANGGDAMGRVVYGLADIGYSLTWGTLPAAAVGAPHRRLRWWGLAYPQDPDREPSDERRFAASRQTQSGRARLDTGRQDRTPTADTDRSRSQGRPLHAERRNERAARPGSLETRFGQYADAIYRWEHILGRDAPDPTDNGRLSPPFVEWMMGYPTGWVTDTLTNRRHALHALGNAVVPQCAAAAFRQLSDRLPT